jgi:hypothetical protein
MGLHYTHMFKIHILNTIVICIKSQIQSIYNSGDVCFYLQIFSPNLFPIDLDEYWPHVEIII